jgi:DNA-binding response OmpR family regulator
MASILMLGLETDLAADLAGILTQEGHSIETVDSIDAAARRRAADLIFAGGDGPDYRETVTRLTAARPKVPVVLVNRLPENNRWLDALELGAADYCGAPFETVQLRWLISSVLRRPAAVAALSVRKDQAAGIFQPAAPIPDQAP